VELLLRSLFGEVRMSIRSRAARCGNWLAAGAIGAGIALLFAPQSGQRTRRLIRRKAERCIQDAGDEVAEKTRGLYIRGKLAADGTARKLRRKLHVAA
jgi:gas vesicle protein